MSTRTIALVAALLMAGGCTELENEAEDASGRPPVTPPGIAPVEGLDLGQSNRPAPSADPAAQSPPAAAPATGNQRQGIIGKSTNEVVDLHAAMAQNPNLKIVEQRAQGGDPVSFAMDAYVDVRSRASTFGMVRAVQLYQAEHGGWPSYEEFTRMLRENRVELTMVYPYQKYAYDSKTGAIVMIEDPDERRRRYEAAGVPVDE